MLGTVSANAATAAAPAKTVHLNGLCVGPDDVYLGLRGLRTLAVRLDRASTNPALAVARWLGQRPEVSRLLHPALREPSGPRAVEARFHRRVAACSAWCSSRCRSRRCYAFLDALELFGIGASWGGYESLAIPFDCTQSRTATRWAPGGRPCAFTSGSKRSRI